MLPSVCLSFCAANTDSKSSDGSALLLCSRDFSDEMPFRFLERDCSKPSCRVLFRRGTGLRRDATLKRAEKRNRCAGEEMKKRREKRG